MKKILVADDDYLLRDLIKDILEGENYVVLEAKDGKEALDLFYQNPELSLVILDIMMPEYSGLEVLRRIRQQSQIPVLILTALGDSENELKGLRGGANDYMSKPFHPEVLLARAENLMRMVQNETNHYMQVGEILVDQN